MGAERPVNGMILWKWNIYIFFIIGETFFTDQALSQFSLSVAISVCMCCPPPDRRRQNANHSRGRLEALFIMHRGKLFPPISPHPMNQQGSPCCFNFLAVTSSYHSKVNLVGALDAEKVAAAVLLYVLLMGFPTSLFRITEKKYIIYFIFVIKYLILAKCYILQLVFFYI